MIPRFDDFRPNPAKSGPVLESSSNADAKKEYERVRDYVMTARLSMDVFYGGDAVAIAFSYGEPNSWGNMLNLILARAEEKWTDRNTDGKVQNAWADAMMLPKKSFDKFSAALKSAHIEIENPRSQSRTVLLRSWEDVDTMLRAIDAAA